jgi:hypothetical protein
LTSLKAWIYNKTKGDKMNRQTLALIIQEGSRLLSGVIQNKDILFRSNKPTEVIEEPTTPITEEISTESINPEQEQPMRSQDISKGTACIPCVNDHLSTCTGLVSDESVRMARRSGIDDDEVVRRILRCSNQLNAMEREDLSVEKIASLPDWEKEIAVYAQNEAADIRHKLNNISTVEDLVDVAGQITETRDKIGKEWFRGRIKNMSPSEKAKVRERAEEILDRELE